VQKEKERLKRIFSLFKVLPFLWKRPLNEKIISPIENKILETLVSRKW